MSFDVWKKIATYESVPENEFLQEPVEEGLFKLSPRAEVGFVRKIFPSRTHRNQEKDRKTISKGPPKGFPNASLIRQNLAFSES